MLMETLCPRCQGSLTWYARGRRAYCQACATTVIELPPPYLPTRLKRVKSRYFRGIVVKKPVGKVYERLWYNGKLIFEGEVDARELVIAIGSSTSEVKES